MVYDTIKHDAEEVQGFAREVVAKRTAIVGAVTTLLLFFTSFTPGFDLSGTVTHWLDVLFAVAGFIATVGVVRPAVTPTSDPRTDSGEKLVPESTVKIQAPVSASEAAVADAQITPNA